MVFPLAFVFILVAAIMLFPPLGLMLGVLAPTPLIFIYLQNGKQIGLIGIGLVFIVLSTLMGMNQAWVFLVEYGVLVFLMAETIRLHWSIERSVLLSGIGSALLSIVLVLTTLSGEDGSPVEFFENQIKEQIGESIKSLEGAGTSAEDIQAMNTFMDQTSSSFASAFPAFIVMGSLIVALLNYTFVRLAWTRMFGEAGYTFGKFTRWSMPDNLIWLFIISSLLSFATQGTPKILGMNVFIVMVVLYMIQGLAIALHYMERKNVPIIFRILLLGLGFSQPILIGMFVGLGLFDLWLDIRKLKVVPDEVSEE